MVTYSSFIYLFLPSNSLLCKYTPICLSDTIIGVSKIKILPSPPTKKKGLFCFEALRNKSFVDAFGTEFSWHHFYFSWIKKSNKLSGSHVSRLTSSETGKQVFLLFTPLYLWLSLIYLNFLFLLLMFFSHYLLVFCYFLKFKSKL